MYPVDTKLTITVTNGNGGAPVALTDPASVGLPAAVGGVVSITSGVKKFAANVLFEARDHDATDTAPTSRHRLLQLAQPHRHRRPADPDVDRRGLLVEDLAPIADFTFLAPAGRPAGDLHLVGERSRRHDQHVRLEPRRRDGPERGQRSERHGDLRHRRPHRQPHGDRRRGVDVHALALVQRRGPGRAPAAVADERRRTTGLQG